MSSILLSSQYKYILIFVYNISVDFLIICQFVPPTHSHRRVAQRDATKKSKINEKNEAGHAKRFAFFMMLYMSLVNI